MKIGLKLWSVNTDTYLREARRLYAEKVFDYLELYVVPGTLETLPLWKALQEELNLPFVIHAPHSFHGVNLADAANSAANEKAVDETKRFADTLGARKIIVHGGWCPENCSQAAALAQLIAQLKSLADERFLIENKPYLPIGDLPRRLVGSTPGEIRSILVASGCGFCLDIGHAIASANAHGADWRVWLADFLALRPSMFHLSDIHVDSRADQHLHFGDGTLPIKEILSRLPTDAALSIETKKDSKGDLEDFRRDAFRLKACLHQTAAAVRLRRAEPRDMRSVFELSNDPVVRANSIRKEHILWETHTTWFNHAIADPDAIFLVAETETGDFVGQIRFNRRGEDWVTSISVVPWLRGRGMTRQMLESAMLHIPHGRFIAEISADNEPSKRLFMSVGFTESKSGNPPAGFLTFIKDAND